MTMQDAGQGQGTPAGTLAGAGAAGQAGAQQGAPAGQQSQAAAWDRATSTRRTSTEDLSPEALATRLARTREQTIKQVREQLKAATGIEDPEALAARWKELQGLSAKEEERRRAELSEIERHKADLLQERTKRTELEQQVQQLQREREDAQRDHQVAQLAGQYVDPEAVSLARIKFAEHLRGLPKEQVSRYEKNPKLVEIWFRGWAKKNARFAIGATTTRAATQESSEQETQQQQTTQTQQASRAAQMPARRPITNGVGPRRAGMPVATGTRPDPSVGANGKTVKPGLSNSMTPQEVREHARKQGINYPS
jgi:hypothetical protein